MLKSLRKIAYFSSIGLLILSPIILFKYIPQRQKLILKSNLKINYPYFFAKYVSLKEGMKAILTNKGIANSQKNDIVLENKTIKYEVIESAWHNIHKTVVPVKDYLYEYNNDTYKFLGGGYIDYINEDSIIGTNGIGEMFIYSISKKKISPISSNLGEIYKKQNYKLKVIPELFGRFGLKDIYFDRKNNRLLASLNVETETGNSCYGMGIYQAEMSANTKDGLINGLDFKQFFKTNSCNSHFSGHASGGRMKSIDNNIIYTVGDFDHSEHGNIRIPQDINNAAGKVIAINSTGLEFKVISRGHRNQQGLEIVGKNIFITEHGPKGGDEINLIIQNKHYGWPFFSYGTTYQDEELFRLNHSGEYEKPLFYFNPSIGISEIGFYLSDEFPYWRNKFIVSSLKDKSIYILDYNSLDNRIISSERINIGHRIRDFVILPKGKIIIITDDQNIVHLSRAENEKIKSSQKIRFLRDSPSP